MCSIVGRGGRENSKRGREEKRREDAVLINIRENLKVQSGERLS